MIWKFQKKLIFIKNFRPLLILNVLKISYVYRQLWGKDHFIIIINQLIIIIKRYIYRIYKGQEKKNVYNNNFRI